MKNLKFHSIFLLLIISGLISYPQNYVADTINWSDPKDINPLDPNSGNFLDIDLYDLFLSANLAQMQGNYKEAASYYLYLLRYNYHDSELIYKLARCYGFINQPDLASQYLIRAINAGYSGFESIRQDKAFSNLQNSPVFQNTLKEIESFGNEYGNTVYIKGIKLTKCQVEFPEEYDNQKPYPLVIGLHGKGGTATGFISLGKHFTKHGFIFAAPQGAYIHSMSDGILKPMYSWEIKVPDKELWKQGDQYSVEYILNVVKYFSDNYKISDVYLMGFSQGAAYTYLSGIKNPDIFKGIICIGGYLPSTDKPYSIITEDEIIAAKYLKVFIAHGKNDQIIDYEIGRGAKNKLKKAGYKVHFLGYSEGHRITPSVLEQVVSWIKSLE